MTLFGDYADFVMRESGAIYITNFVFLIKKGDEMFLFFIQSIN